MQNMSPTLLATLENANVYRRAPSKAQIPQPSWHSRTSHSSILCRDQECTAFPSLRQQTDMARVAQASKAVVYMVKQ